MAQMNCSTEIKVLSVFRLKANFQPYLCLSEIGLKFETQQYFFLNVFCVSGTQLQNLLFLLEPVMSLVTGRTTNCLPLASHVCLGRIFCLWQTKNPLLLKSTYILLEKKKMF